MHHDKKEEIPSCCNRGSSGRNIHLPDEAASVVNIVPVRSFRSIRESASASLDQAPQNSTLMRASYPRRLPFHLTSVGPLTWLLSASIFTIRFATPWHSRPKRGISSDSLECVLLNQGHIDQSCVGGHKGLPSPAALFYELRASHRFLFVDLELEPYSELRVARVVQCAGH